jgi:2-polyprenyl-6-methoxyphenol hydroxylase-like FAD-dependent oxidoreductase
MDDVIIVGGGIGGLTLGLMLHAAGIPCRIYESTPQLRPLGVGINLLPHCMKELVGLGLEEPLSRISVVTEETRFFNRFGQLVHQEPLGRFAGYDYPQLSIHRGDLQLALHRAFVERAGEDRFLTGWRCTHVDQDSTSATVHFVDSARESLPQQRGAVVIGCDGIHSAVRKHLFPNEGPARYSGVNMWRGVTRWKPFMTAATMLRVGWLVPGKGVIYPIRPVEPDGNQLINWVIEIETERYKPERDWNRPGDRADFFDVVKDWRFEWLDIAGMIESAEMVLEFPMVDRDPLDRWSFGRVTLLGDAAHPMYPRGSNGAGQAVLDCRALVESLLASAEPAEALRLYEEKRLKPTSDVVLANRKIAPDVILREVYERTGDKPFDNIDDVIPRSEIAEMMNRYKRVAAYDKDSVAKRR